MVLNKLEGTERLTVLHDPDYLAFPPPALSQGATSPRVFFWAFGSTSYAYPQ